MIEYKRGGNNHKNNYNRGNTMRNFVYLIGSTDDFDSIEDLKSEYFNAFKTGEVDVRNMSVFPITLSDSCVITGYNSIEEIATMLGRGEAFCSDWTMDDTVSVLLEA